MLADYAEKGGLSTSLASPPCMASQRCVPDTRTHPTTVTVVVIPDHQVHVGKSSEERNVEPLFTGLFISEENSIRIQCEEDEQDMDRFVSRTQSSLHGSSSCSSHIYMHAQAMRAAITICRRPSIIKREQKKNPIVAESKITDQETHADRELADYTSRGDEENKAGDGDQ